jgi:hypothetical protein
MVDELIEGAFRCYDRDRIAAARKGRLDRRMRPVFAGEIVSIDGKLAPEDGVFVALSDDNGPVVNYRVYGKLYEWR